MNDWRGVLQYMIVSGLFGLSVVVVVGYLSWRFRR